MIKILRATVLLPIFALAAMAQAQSWARSYEDGLAAARQGKWSDARAAFKQAASMRPEDASSATTLPGPPTERRQWREGAAYSPNFLAAYALYRQGLAKTGDEQAEDLKSAAAEFEVLLKKNQSSRETYYFLNTIYNKIGDTASRIATEERFAKSQDKLRWRVDTEVVSPEELAAIGGTTPAQPLGNNSVTIRAGDLRPGTGDPAAAAVVPGRVPTVPTKYALIVGNSTSSLPGATLPFAGDDAQRVREAIMANAGYAQENIELVLNATAQQISTSAKALADRMPADATVLIFFSGAGTNVGGKDYIAGVDTDSVSNTASMLSKADLFQPFMAKGARVFSFFQANRSINEGRYFGSEIPMVGTIAQVQATLPGDTVSAIMTGGRQTGIFTNAFVEVLQDLKSNRIPILEFGWQVFYKIRRGNTGTTGGGSRQTPTLPVLTNVASDARF
jgi:tetratricopeptide (TPR) repeat protein